MKPINGDFIFTDSLLIVKACCAIPKVVRSPGKNTNQWKSKYVAAY